MKKELFKKLQIGVVSLSTIALLAACGNDGVDDPPMDGEPGVEDPMDDEEDTGGGQVEEEEDAN